MCEVCRKWQPELGIQENELCLFEAFAFKSCKVLSAFWKVMLSLLSTGSQDVFTLQNSAWKRLSSTWSLVGDAWGKRTWHVACTLICLMYVMYCTSEITDVSQNHGKDGYGERKSLFTQRRERQQCRQQCCSPPSAAGLPPGKWKDVYSSTTRIL